MPTTYFILIFILILLYLIIIIYYKLHVMITKPYAKKINNDKIYKNIKHNEFIKQTIDF